jgi:hypothetical protein
MKGILACHTFANVNFNGVLEVAGTVKVQGSDIFLDVNQGGVWKPISLRKHIETVR